MAKPQVLLLGVIDQYVLIINIRLLASKSRLLNAGPQPMLIFLASQTVLTKNGPPSPQSQM
jgi:hypothetical protein